MHDTSIRIEPAPAHEALTIHAASRYSVARITHHDLIEGPVYETLAASTARGKQYTYQLDAPCLFSIYIDLGSDKLLPAWYCHDGEGRHRELSKEAFEQESTRLFPVRFHDIRSIVQRAFETTDTLAARTLWRACRHGLMRMRHDTPEFEPTAQYVQDYLDRYIEREPMTELQGTTKQRQWAKKIRLRAIQRVGLLFTPEDSASRRIDLCLAKLAARTLPDASTWISASERLKHPPPEDTLRWLISLL